MDLGLDIDGVLYPFDLALAQHVEAAYGLEPGSLPPATEWNFYRGQWGMTEEEYRAVFRAGCAAGSLFTHLPPYEGAPAALRRLAARGHRLHYITARGIPGVDPGKLRAETKAWLRRHGFPVHSLAVTADKAAACAERGVRLFLDDSPANYDALEAAGLEPWLLDRPWNADHSGRRVASLEGFVTLSERLSAESGKP